VFRIAFIVAALGFSGWVPATTFDGLELDEIMRAVRSLDDARHGIVAFLGPASITSVVPGPSDLPIRHRMLTSWGRTSGEATLAVAAGGIFSVGIKLVLPIIAAIGLIVSDAPLGDTMQTVVTIV